MERGLKIPQGERTKTTNSLLISLMKQLEKVYFFYIIFLGCLFFLGWNFLALFLNFQGCVIFLTLFDEMCLFGSCETRGKEIENWEFGQILTNRVINI